ncbi:hypothetical protein DFH09DRAFT_502805 [Mycena vulgaris]|nr:hypothetical protein DFH09DRAFT_502805 [Mycena vulgaris]
MPSRSAEENELVTPAPVPVSRWTTSTHSLTKSRSTSRFPQSGCCQEAPKTPAERVESMMRDRGHAKMGSFQRLKSLTKRYSLPFPGTARPKPGRNATAGCVNRASLLSYAMYLKSVAVYDRSRAAV